MSAAVRVGGRSGGEGGVHSRPRLLHAAISPAVGGQRPVGGGFAPDIAHRVGLYLRLLRGLLINEGDRGAADLLLDKGVAVQGLRRLPVHACACRKRQNGGRGVGHRRAVLQRIANGDGGVGLIFGAVVGEDVPRPVHHLKADGVAGVQRRVLRELINERAVDETGTKVAARVFQRALGPELGLFAPDGNGKVFFRQKLHAVSVLHPQAQRHGLLLGVGEVLNDGPQLDLPPLHVRREAVFVVAAQKAALPICLIPLIAGVICVSISIGLLGGIFIVAGVQLHLRYRRIEGGRVGDQLAHALGALKGAHIAEFVSSILPHEALEAGIVHIRIVRVRAGIGVTEAQHALPLYLRGLRRVRDVQRGAVGRFPHRGRAGRILVA